MIYDDRQTAWDREQGESAAAYHAFCHYRDLPAEARSVRTAAELHGRVCLKRPTYSPKCAPGGWKDWAEQYRWSTRVRAYDDHVNALKLKAHEQQLVDMARRHAQQAQAAMHAILTPSRLLLERMQKAVAEPNSPEGIRARAELEALDMRALIRMTRNVSALPALAQIERLSVGLETERIKVQTQETVDQQETLADLTTGDDEAEDLITQLMERVTTRRSESGGTGVAHVGPEVGLSPTPHDPQ